MISLQLIFIVSENSRKESHLHTIFHGLIKHLTRQKQHNKITIIKFSILVQNNTRVGGIRIKVLSLSTP
jgi:hypothetical protein